ncbi:MAG: hypothetical protein ACI9G6_002608, partial [Limisphaerales bacterium]
MGTRNCKRVFRNVCLPQNTDIELWQQKTNP